MPKIPIPNRPAVPEHHDNAVHSNVAPDLNWNVNHDDPGRALQQLGNHILNAGLKIGDYLKDYAEERQKAEDTDAFQELELLTIQANNDMNAFMRDNPGRYEDFSREYQTRFEALEERRTEIKNRMSTQGKKAADFYIQKDRLSQTETVSRIERQAFVTAKTQNLETRLSQFAKMGQPVADVQRMIDDYTVGEYPILTPEMADAYMAKYLEQADFFRVRELIDAGDPSVIDKLKKKSDGSFTEYTHLTRDQREQLIRAAETQKNKAALEDTQRFLADANKGIFPTEDELKKQHEAGALTDQQFNQHLDILKQIQNEADRAHNKAERDLYYRIVSDAYNGSIISEDELKKLHATGGISDNLFNDTFEFVKRFNANAESEAERNKSKQKKAGYEEYVANLNAGYPVKYNSFDKLKEALNKHELDFDEFNDYWTALSRREEARERAQDHAQKTFVNALKWDIYRARFTSKPEIAYQEAARFKNIIEKSGINPENQQALMDFLSDRISDTLNQKTDEFLTPEGDDVYNFILDSYWVDSDSKKGTESHYQGLHSRATRDQEFQRAQYFNIMEVAREKLREGVPAEKIKDEIKQRVMNMNIGKISDIMNSAYRPTTTPDPNSVPHIGWYPGLF